MLFAREPFLLHLLAGSDTITALDAAKALLDAGTHAADEREPCDNLAPLHVAAAWGNLAMCQLLIHYGADVQAEDIDKRRPVDVAEGQCRRFLKRLGRKRRTERTKFGKVLSFMFRCAHTAVAGNQSMLAPATPEAVATIATKGPDDVGLRNNSCPSLNIIVPCTQRRKHIQKLSNVLPPPPYVEAADDQQRRRPRPTPSAPPVEMSPRQQRRSSSLAREAFLTDDNTQTTTDGLLNVAMLSGATTSWRHHEYLLERERLAPDKDEQHDDEQQQDGQVILKNDGGQQAAINNEHADNAHDDIDDDADNDEVEHADDDYYNQQQRFQWNDGALRHQFASLRLAELRERLRLRNCIAGPLSAGNRHIYETKLAWLETRRHHQQKRDPSTIGHYSQALRRTILTQERGDISPEIQLRIGAKEEAQIRGEYAHSPLDKKEVSFFCYLLIDPSLLPPSGHFGDVSLRRFLSAIFYVGKGKRSRPLHHLVQASKCRDFATANPLEQSDKLKRILALWDRGEGVISQQLFCNIHSAEAHVREGAMIDAIGVDNLTNVVRGTFPGLAVRQWSRKQIAEFGALLLCEAHAIFQHERCRPIRETDLEH